MYKTTQHISAMEKYTNYRLEDFLLDDAFREWVHSGAVLTGSIWEEFLWKYPEKKEIIDQAVVLVGTWKRLPSALSDKQMHRDIDAILGAIEKPRKAVRLLRYRWMGYAAGFALLLSAAVYFLGNRQLWQEKAAAVLTAQGDIEVFNAEKADRIITLPDGSLVRLSPGSQITYSSAFADLGLRNVNLIGEAFFEVKRDTLRPFSVYSGGITTRVLGTSFTVRAGAKDVSVTVNTGKVAVSRSGRESEPLVLTPNQKAVYVAAEQKLTKALAEVPVIVSQEELKGRFAFDGEPAGKIFQALEKAYRISIQFDEARLKDCYVTLPFREEPFYRKLDILCRTIGATYQVTDDGVIIESKGCE